MHLVGLDIGTSGCRSFIFTPRGRIVSSSYREYSIRCPQPTWCELEPGEVWSQIVTVIRESVSAGKVDPKDIQAISISALGDSIMPVDKDGHCIYPTLLLYDQRAIRQRRDIAAEFGTLKLEEVTGSPSVRPVMSNIMWFKKVMPEIYRRTSKFIGWHEYVTWRLCGKPVIDRSLAQATGVYDRRKCEWSTEIMDALGAECHLMPEIAVAGTMVGEVSSEAAKETGLAKGTILVVGAHDTPDCSALGAGVVYEGLALDLTGTVESAQVCGYPNVGGPTKLLCGGIHRTSSIYISRVGGVSTSGSILKWFKDVLSQEDIIESRKSGRNVYDLLMARAAEVPAGSNKLLVIPDFAGGATRGAIVGLTLGHRKNDVIRALLEGITYEMRLGLESGEQRGITIKEIRALGGGAKSCVWVQLKADIYKKRIVIPAVTEGGSLGAAILAGVGVGVYRDAFDGVSKTYRQKAVFTPNEEAAGVYDRYYEVYKRLRRGMDPIVKDLIAT